MNDDGPKSRLTSSFRLSFTIGFRSSATNAWDRIGLETSAATRTSQYTRFGTSVPRCNHVRFRWIFEYSRFKRLCSGCRRYSGWVTEARRRHEAEWQESLETGSVRSLSRSFYDSFAKGDCSGSVAVQVNRKLQLLALPLPLPLLCAVFVQGLLLTFLIIVYSFAPRPLCKGGSAGGYGALCGEFSTPSYVCLPL